MRVAVGAIRGADFLAVDTAGLRKHNGGSLMADHRGSKVTIGRRSGGGGGERLRGGEGSRRGSWTSWRSWLRLNEGSKHHPHNWYIYIEIIIKKESVPWRTLQHHKRQRTPRLGRPRSSWKASPRRWGRRWTGREQAQVEPPQHDSHQICKRNIIYSFY